MLSDKFMAIFHVILAIIALVSWIITKDVIFYVSLWACIIIIHIYIQPNNNE